MDFFTTVDNLLLHEKNSKQISPIKGKEITERMRNIVIDWMTSVCDMFKLRLDTYFNAINILDICLSNITITKTTLQLYSTAAIMIAAKKYECYSPESSDYIYVVDGAFTKEKLLETEIEVIKLLDGDLEIANIVEYHRYIRCKYSDIYPNIDDVKAQLMMEITNMICMCWSLVNRYHVLPSLIVTAAFHIANIYVQYDVDDEYIIFNPFNIDEALIIPIYHQHIKNIILLDKSSLVAIKTRFIKKIQSIPTTYEQFIRFMKLLSKYNSYEFSNVTQYDQMMSPEKIYPNGKIPFVDKKDYKKIKSIGSGSYGKVYITNRVGRDYAMKLFRTEHYDEGISSQYLREVSVLLNIRHESVIEITGILSNLRGFLMELMDDNLKNYYDEHPDVVKDHSFQLFITNKLLSALNYLHKRGIMNRDIKPQNILVKGIWGANFEVKICDFGLCRGMGIAISGISATSEICTLWYRPIEILLGSTAYFGPTIDIWSLGCTLYEIFTRKVLFLGDCESDQVLAIFKIKGTPDKTHVLREMPDFPKNIIEYKNIFDEMFECFDKNVALVIKSALEYDPSNRPSANSLLEQWIMCRD